VPGRDIGDPSAAILDRAVEHSVGDLVVGLVSRFVLFVRCREIDYVGVVPLAQIVKHQALGMKYIEHPRRA